MGAICIAWRTMPNMVSVSAASTHESAAHQQQTAGCTAADQPVKTAVGPADWQTAAAAAVIRDSHDLSTLQRTPPNLQGEEK